MPLPDAPNTSPRVYTLLQNTDLETVTQANLATLGNPISVEELNEDELRRLVLVNLARLSVKSEWNGLLTAASGGTSWNNPSSEIMASTDDTFYPAAAPPWGGSGTTTSRVGENDVGGTVTYPIYYPFISPTTGTVDKLGVRSFATDSSSIAVAIFSNTSDNGPGAMIGGEATLDLSTSTTVIGSPASTVSLTAGTQYWVGYVMTTSVTGPLFYMQNTGPGLGTNTGLGASSYPNLSKYCIYDPSDTGNALPSTAATSGYVGVNRKIHLEITWAP